MANIITLEEYKSYQGLTKTDTDSKYTFLITAASNLIKTYLGNVFSPEESPITEYFTVEYDTDTLFPTYWPIHNVLSVEELDRYTTDSSIHVPLQHGSQYIFNGDTITRIPGALGFASWPIGPSNVKVVYEAGYNETDGFPDAIKLACIELVNYYQNKEFVPSRSIQGATIINAGSGIPDLPAHVRAILDYYKG